MSRSITPETTERHTQEVTVTSELLRSTDRTACRLRSLRVCLSSNLAHYSAVHGVRGCIKNMQMNTLYHYQVPLIKPVMRITKLVAHSQEEPESPFDNAVSATGVFEISMESNKDIHSVGDNSGICRPRS
jgi:hypothetical protein